MKNPFPSITIGLILLSTVVFPPLVYLGFRILPLSSCVTFIAGLYIFLFVVINSVPQKFQCRGTAALFIAVVMGIILQGTVIFLIKDNFDFGRFLQSYLLLIIYLLGAFSFVFLAQKTPKLQTHFAVQLLFYVLLLSGIAGILNYSPFSPEVGKPVLFFAEPSHFALSFLPTLLYMAVTASSSMKLPLVLLGYSIGFFLENLTLVVGITIVSVIVIPRRMWLFFVPVTPMLLVFMNFDYYTDRLVLSSNNQNLSTLVYLSGWERAYLNFVDTLGIGVGFQQFGIIGRRGEIMDAIEALINNDLNVLDGGSVASKFIGEFGLFGVTMIIVYLLYFLKSARWLHNISVNEVVAYDCRWVFFLSCFVMYFIDLFVRGTGYFSPSGFFFVASLAWMTIEYPSWRTIGLNPSLQTPFRRQSQRRRILILSSHKQYKTL